MGFKAKLILSYIAVILASFISIAYFIDKNLEENSLGCIKSSLINQANLIAGQISNEALNKEDSSYLDNLVRDLSLRAVARLTVIDLRGKVLADSEKSREELPAMENHLNRPEVRAALRGDRGVDTHYSKTLKMYMLYVAAPLKSIDTIVGAVRLALPLESIDRTLFAIRKIILAGLIFAIILSIFIGSLVAAHITRPINNMIQVSRKYAEGDLSRRVLFISKDELGQLATTLNKMAEDIEDKIKQIKMQNQRFAAIFNSMVEGVIVIDGTGHIVSINPTVEKTFGITKEEAGGVLFLEAIRNNELWEIISSVLKKGETVAKETSIIYPVRKVFQANATPIFETAHVSGCLVVIHDITEMKRLETMRSDFVANVSHELKTPLTSIKGFTETLLDGALDDKEDGCNFLRIIQDHAGRLESLVDDLLALAHLESKEITLDKKEFDLKKHTDEIISGFGSQIKKKHIAIKNELPSGLLIKGDKNRIDQVVTNLIDNAIKFNKENGSIEIYSQASGDVVKITIEDSGVGIPGKDTTRIFERFYRVDKARSRELGGTGLGLSIVKHIIELHGGTVGVESVEGMGSKFWFTLPA